MPKRIVSAVVREGRLLELLEDVDLRPGQRITVTLDLPEKEGAAATRPHVELRCVPGTVLTPLNRRGIYDHLG